MIYCTALDSFKQGKLPSNLSNLRAFGGISLLFKQQEENHYQEKVSSLILGPDVGLCGDVKGDNEKDEREILEYILLSKNGKPISNSNSLTGFISTVFKYKYKTKKTQAVGKSLLLFETEKDTYIRQKGSNIIAITIDPRLYDFRIGLFDSNTAVTNDTAKSEGMVN